MENQSRQAIHGRSSRVRLSYRELSNGRPFDWKLSIVGFPREATSEGVYSKGSCPISIYCVEFYLFGSYPQGDTKGVDMNGSEKRRTHGWMEISSLPQF